MIRRFVLFVVVAWLSTKSNLMAEDSFFRVRWNELKIVDGEFPTYKNANDDSMMAKRFRASNSLRECQSN